MKLTIKIMEVEHVSLIVTSNTEKAYDEAISIYGDLSFLVSPIVRGLSNIQLSFFIAPSGSFKNHTGAAFLQLKREQFKDWCKANKADYTEVKVGYQSASVETVNQIRKAPPSKEKEAGVSNNWLDNKLETYD